MSVRVIAVDPGGTTGLCIMDVTENGMPLIMCMLQLDDPHKVLNEVENYAGIAAMEGNHAVIVTEQFIVGRRAAQSRSAGAGQKARSINGMLEGTGYSIRYQNASAAKAFATNDRLKAMGVPIRHKDRHALDALRHALFYVVKSRGVIDPLSPKYRPDEVG